MALRIVLPVLLAMLSGGLLGLSKLLGSQLLRGSGLALGLIGAAVLVLFFRRYYPRAGLAVVGTLRVQPDALVWQPSSEEPRRVELSPNGPAVTIWYTGYEGELLGRKELPGYENFIALAGGVRQRFWVPNAGKVADLRLLVRSWYHRRVVVREYCQDSRTFLLARDLSYEQIQAYKQEFGVGLYT